jgi:hypothetical protein
MPTDSSHRVAAHFNTVGVMNQAIENAVRDGGIADLFVPSSYWHLRSQDHAPGLIALLADFPEVPAFPFSEGRHCPVIDHPHIDAADPGQ